MNQIVKMFEDSNERLRKIMSGNYSREQIEDAHREFKGQIKLANVVIHAYAIASKNKRASVALEKMNLLDDHTAIDLGLDPEQDCVRCPEINSTLKREDCLNFSGSHPEICNGCDHFAETRKMLLRG